MITWKMLVLNSWKIMSEMEGKAYEVVPKVFSGHYHLINFYCQLISFRYYLLACIIISDFAYG
jgi:hypothetical protein